MNGFPPHSFPLTYNGHEIFLASNTLRRTNDKRLRFHYTLKCIKCDEEAVVRGRFPSDIGEEASRNITAKMMTFGPFVRNECSWKRTRATTKSDNIHP